MPSMTRIAENAWKTRVQALRQFTRAQRGLARPSLREALLAVYRGAPTGADDQ